MKRLVDESDPALSELTKLVASAERQQPSPFAKRHLHSRIMRSLEGGSFESGSHRVGFRPALLGAGALLIAATAAAAGYTILTPASAPLAEAPSAVVVPPTEARRVPAPAPAPAPAPVTPRVEVEVKDDKPSERRVEKPRLAGEDPTQVADAVRALRKQGDPVRAQALLDQYLRSNPRGALAEDALALSIEAAAARKDPRAADYARRYLARYPQGRFRAVAERVLAKP
jgi:hypothetical protein